MTRTVRHSRNTTIQVVVDGPDGASSSGSEIVYEVSLELAVDIGLDQVGVELD
jgi:hypothetical protein